MSFWTLLRHRWQALVRSVSFERRVVTLLVVGLAGLYFAGGLAVLGFVVDDAIRAATTRPPAQVLARWMGAAGVAYLVVRLFTESGVGVSPQPYAHLPIRPRALARQFAATAFASLFNALPLAFAIPFGAQTVVQNGLLDSAGYVVAWVVWLALTTYPVPILRAGLQHRLRETALGLGVLVAGVGGLVWVGEATVLIDASGWLFGGLMTLAPLPIVGAGVLLATLAAGYARTLRHTLRADRSRRHRASSTASTLFERLVARGPLGREVAVELQLITRNGQPLSGVFFSLLFALMVIVLGVLTADQSIGELITQPMLWFFAAGSLGFTYGQRMFSWEGRSFDAFMARPDRLRTRVLAKLLVLSAGSLVCTLLPLPVLLWVGSEGWRLLGTYLVYCVGVFNPLVVLAATFLQKPSSLSFTFVDTNVAGGHMVLFLLGALPGFFVPIAVRALGGSPSAALLGLAGVGGASLLAAPIWIRGITALLRRNRYRMMSGFRSAVEESV